MAVAAGIPDVRFEHGVVAHTAHGNPVIRQYIDVVLRVLADFRLVRIFENRPQHFQDDGAIELRGRTGIVVHQRHVGALSFFDGEGNADDFRAHRIDTRGFGIEGDEIGLLQFAEPRVELLARENEIVFAFDRQRRIDRGTRRHLRGLDPRRRLPHLRGRLGGVEFFQCRLEFVAVVKIAQEIILRIAQPQICRLEFQRHIGLDRRELTRQRKMIERDAQILADLARDFVRVRDHRIERAVFG